MKITLGSAEDSENTTIEMQNYQPIWWLSIIYTKTRKLWPLWSLYCDTHKLTTKLKYEISQHPSSGTI